MEQQPICDNEEQFKNPCRFQISATQVQNGKVMTANFVFNSINI